MMGKPVIRGTRIPVELIVRKLSEGATEADLLDAYPRLVIEDIRAALAYVTYLIACETAVPRFAIWLPTHKYSAQPFYGFSAELMTTMKENNDNK